MLTLGFLAAGETPFDSDFEFIESVELASDASSISFNSIPSVYTHLELRVFVRSAHNTDKDELHMVINNDTTASAYYRQTTSSDTNSYDGGTATLDNKIVLGEVPGAQQNANEYTAGIIKMPGANSPNLNVPITYTGNKVEDGDNINYVVANYLTDGTVTQIDFTLNSTNDFRLGSYIGLYGMVTA